MTADDRLNQLEPLLAETITILDRHTSQLKQLNNNVVQLNAAVTQQSDNIAFLLREQLVVKADVAKIRDDISGLKNGQAEIRGDISGLKNGQAEIRGDISGLKNGQAEIRGDISGLKTDVAEIRGDVSGLKNGQAETNGKLDQLLQLLQKPGS